MSMATCLRVGRCMAIDSRSLFASASRFSSSSSSSSSSGKPKTAKKLTDRLSAVIDAVNDRKLPPELRGQRNNVRSETDMINVVEQRIWHSMEEGQFENLPGKGKPLKLDTNPHADPAEDTLYRILSKNGCAPEWVELNKEIRSKISEWRMCLKKARATKCSGDHSEWLKSSEALKLQLREINDKVFRYNLIVPFGRQMFGFKWEKELGYMEEE
ncbi:DnaJ-like subfamily C member 28 [Mucuna pruriens]|uniref:DnaJ-like subfamily C member 28 n=1 Tax=Mucuna pruriens TaxID=157652 RepID=A0A371FUK1_MUCPR|nr:DnaJ-like subfamily C member 28 [Mucuna pruriens]